MVWDRLHRTVNSDGRVTCTPGYLSEQITLGNNADASTSHLDYPTKSDATILVKFSADLSADTYVQVEHSWDGVTWVKHGEFEEDATVDHDDISKNMAKIAAIDDSLVRGTSSKAIIKALRRSGARKISMMVTYPPIKFPCYAGIDFPSQEELATFDGGKDLSEKEMIEKVRNDIGADFLGYNDAENLANAVGIPKDSMCFTCATGDYAPLGITPNFNKMKQMKSV